METFLTGEQARTARTAALQQRICGVPPPLPTEPDELVAQLRRCLWEAAEQGALKTQPHEICKLLKKSKVNQPAGHLAILGGEKNQERLREIPHFARDDGAWFDFAITISFQPRAPLMLLAYNFEIRFPKNMGPDFVRFDLNPAGHANAEEGLRSHIHPSSDDLSTPSPFMSPLEILDILVYGLRLPKERKPRGA